MSREAKIFEPNVWGVQETITHYEAFGWELLSINGKQIVMSRENYLYTFQILTSKPLNARLSSMQFVRTLISSL